MYQSCLQKGHSSQEEMSILKRGKQTQGVTSSVQFIHNKSKLYNDQQQTKIKPIHIYTINMKGNIAPS